MPELTLPVDIFEIAKAVAEEFRSHERHARDRACVDVAALFEARAGQLRANPTLSDPLAYALTQRCHTQDGGVVHASPHLVAAVAYEAVAAVLALGDPTRNETEAGDGRA